MAQKRDYYEVLSLPRNASAEDIKKAYRKAALAHHPDRNAGDKKAESKFKEATEAYQILADPEKRELFDRYGHDAVSGAAAGFSFCGGTNFFRPKLEAISPPDAEKIAA